MPQRKSGIKELRKNHRRHMHNLDIKTDLKKTIKKYLAAVVAQNSEESQTLLRTVYKKLDKATKRNILEKNTASRRKSKFTKMLPSASQ